MSDPGLGAFQRPPGGNAVETRGPGDPVSWLQIEQGWKVLTADGDELGTVAQVASTKNADIFDGLAVQARGSSSVLYVPGEQVSTIYPRSVTLKITAAQTIDLAPYSEAPLQKTLRPGPESLGARASRWFRGR